MYTYVLKLRGTTNTRNAMSHRMSLDKLSVFASYVACAPGMELSDLGDIIFKLCICIVARMTT